MVGLRETIQTRNHRLDAERSNVVAADLQTSRVWDAGKRAWANYRPKPYDGRIVFFEPSHRRLRQFDPTVGWSRTVNGGLTIRQVAGYKGQLLREPYVAELARAIGHNLPDAPK